MTRVNPIVPASLYLLGSPSLFCGVDATYWMDLREYTDLLFARFDARLEQRVSRLEHQIGRLEERMTTTLRWMFLFWATTTAALVGLALR